MNTLIMPFLVVVGAISGILLDTFWFSKKRTGLKIIEHYHVGLALFIGAALSTLHGNELWSLSLGFALIGAGMFMFLAEWRQTPEIKGKHIASGHPFGLGSEHFKESTLLGLIGVGIMGYLLHLLR